MTLLAKTYRENSNSLRLQIAETDESSPIFYLEINVKVGTKVQPSYPRKLQFGTLTPIEYVVRGIDPASEISIILTTYDKTDTKLNTLTLPASILKKGTLKPNKIRIDDGNTFTLTTPDNKKIRGSFVNNDGVVALNSESDYLDISLPDLKALFSSAVSKIIYTFDLNTSTAEQIRDPYVEINQDGSIVSGIFYHDKGGGTFLGGLDNKDVYIENGVEILSEMVNSRTQSLNFCYNILDAKIVKLLFYDLARKVNVEATLDGFTPPVTVAPKIDSFTALEDPTNLGTLNISYSITDADSILTNVTLTYNADGVAKSKDYGTSLSKTNDAIILGEGVVVTNLLLTATSSEPEVTKTAPDLTLSTTVPTTNAPVITTFTAVEDAIFGTLDISYVITDADAITTNVTLSYDADGTPATKDYLTSLTKTNDPIIIGEGVVVSNLLLTVKSTEPDVTKTAPNVTLSTSTPAVLAPSITTFTFVENTTTFGDVDYAYEVLDSDAITTGISLTYTVDGTPATAIDLGVALTGGATITIGEGAVITVPLLTVSSSEPDVTKSAPGITLSTTPVVPTAPVISSFTVVNNATTPGNVDVAYTITDPDNEVTNIKIDYLLDTVAGTAIDLGVVLTGSNTYTTVPGTVISGIVMTVTTTSSGNITQTAPDLTVTTTP